MGAVYAGAKFFGGYPITPSTEVAEVLSVELPKVGGKFIQMEDEIAAMASIIGASLTGAKSITATSGPGVSLKQELIGYACIAEVPCVIINVMRGGPSTGMPTNLAEKYRMPVQVLFDEIVGHMRERIEFPEPGELEVIDREAPTVSPADYKPYDSTKGQIPPLADFGSEYKYHVTGLNKADDGFPTTKASLVDAEERRQIDKVMDNIADIESNEEYMTEDADVVIWAYGSTSRSARYAVNELRKEGIKAGLFRPITLWPFPEKRTAELAIQAKAIVVAEMNLGQMVFEVERVAKGNCVVVHEGRVDGDPINPGQIMDKVKEVL
jgi:2-oxoglutarate ferredoxin oxidoreductase subunit alpha